MSTAFLFHEKFLQHDTGAHHPENAGRLQAIVSGLKQHKLWGRLMHIEPEPASEEQVLLVHTKRHFDYIKKCAEKGSYQIDPDTHMSSASFDAALLAAGAAIKAVDGIMNGEFKTAFAAVRPPGHHALQDQAMGFCLFNNVAIAARHAIIAYKLNSVLIVDWDVHHGNGTQEIFYGDAAVVYLSLHKKHHYPGTGWEFETGDGEAAGTIINIPVGPPYSPALYESCFDAALARVERYAPELILISCGFDAHENDPLGNLGLTNETYADLTSKLIRFSETFGHRRIASILEGGYDYDALANASSAHIAALML